MRRLRIKNWAEFQHYRTRRPPWIKLHRGLLDDHGWHRLPETSRAVGPMLWLLASEHADGVIPYDLETIAFRLHMTGDKVDAALGPLIGAGFLIEEHDASEPPAAGKHPASPESRERVRDKERDRARGARARGAKQDSRDDDRIGGPCAAKPFDIAQGRPFDFAQGGPFGFALGRQWIGSADPGGLAAG